MQKIYTAGNKKNCVVCNHKTVNAYEYGYVDGISIRVPVCRNCKKNVGIGLNNTMESHLKAIKNAVVMSRIIEADERQLQEIERKYL